MDNKNVDKILHVLQEVKEIVSEMASWEHLPPRLLTIKEACQYLGIGSTEAYAKIRQNVRCIKHGRKILVPKEELDHLVEKAKRTGKLFD